MCASTGAASCQRRPLLLALDSDAFAELRATLKAEGKTMDPQDAVGMFYGTRCSISSTTPSTMRSPRRCWLENPVCARAFPGREARPSDLVDAKSGDVVVEAGTKITPRLAKQADRKTA